MKPYKLIIFLVLLLIAFAAGPVSHAADYEEALTYWTFDDGGGTAVYDSSSSNSATLIGDPTWTTGKYGGALSFGGGETWLGTYTGDVTAPMTSYTSPAPNVVSDDQHFSDRYGWRAFDEGTSSTWFFQSTGGTGSVTYDFGVGNTQRVERVELAACLITGSTHSMKNWKFYGSNNNSNWTLLTSGTHANNSNWEYYNFANDNEYRYYKTTVENSYLNDTNVAINEMRMKEKNYTGSTDYVAVSNEANFDFDRTDAFSASAWVDTSSTETQFLISKMTSSPSCSGYELYMTGSGALGTYIINDWATKNAINEYTVDSGFNDGQWHYVTFTYDGTSTADGTKIYVDGVELITQINYNALTGSILNNEELRFGSRAGYDGYYFDGDMDDVGFWDRELDAYEIGAIYDMGIEAYEHLALGADDLTLGYTTEQLAVLAQLYADGKAGLTPDDVAVGDSNWTYLSGDLPGDIGGTTYNIGDSWIYDGKYYIKLGSGLEGGAVPEIPPFAVQGMAMVFGSISIWVRRRRVKGSKCQRVKESENNALIL